MFVQDFGKISNENSLNMLYGYLHECLGEIVEDDGLLVMGKGMGLSLLLSQLVKLFVGSEHLCFVINLQSDTIAYVNSVLQSEGLGQTQRLVPITASTSPQFRKHLYLEGGCFAVTSRILIVDMLSNSIPIPTIDGFIVANAHRVHAGSSEAFILRLFRNENKNGFIKAVSDAPEAFMSNNIENTMKCLFVKRLFLWPRYRTSVSDTFEANPVDLVEIGVALSPSMLIIQECLLELIQACIEELKRSQGSNLQMEFIKSSIDSSDRKKLFKRFDRSIKRQLDPIWHEVGPKAKQLITDLGVLGDLLHYLVQYDCVSFYEFLFAVRSSERYHQSLWLFTDSAQKLFAEAKKRIYKVKFAKSEGKVPGSLDVSLNGNPKWPILFDILKEVHEENVEEKGAVVVFTKDKASAAQVRTMIQLGSSLYLKQKWWQYLKRRRQKDHKKNPETRKEIELSLLYEEYELFLRKFGNAKQMQTELSLPKRPKIDPEIIQFLKMEKNSLKSEIPIEDLVAEYDTDSSPKLLGSDPLKHELYVVPLSDRLRTLAHIRPKFIIVLEPHLEVLREIELFQVNNPNEYVRLYFMLYNGSVEEDSFITSVERENSVFESLIESKAIMVIPENQDGKSNVAQKQEKSSRKAKVSKPKQIIVDVREFRSSLPGSLDKRGFIVLPTTLEIGDYLLSPLYCVERKSIPDLFGSLNSGRLYNQMTAMSQAYKVPILLIEFDKDRTFCLNTAESIGNEISESSIISKLCTLVLHFPKMRIIWSASSDVTARMFEEIMKLQEPPVLKEGEEEEDSSMDTIMAREMLKLIPGMNDTTVLDIINTKEIKCLKDLVTSDQTFLESVIGTSNAWKVSKFASTDFSQSIV